MVNKSGALFFLNLFGVPLIIVLLALSIDFNSPEVIVLALISALILGFLDYMILSGAERVVKSIQYKAQKTFTCPKCYTIVEKGEGTSCPRCGNKI